MTSNLGLISACPCLWLPCLEVLHMQWRGQGTNWHRRPSLWLMAMLCLLTVLMAQSGFFGLPVRSRTTLNVALVTQNNKSMPKDGHLPAHSMSVKVKQTKRVTLSTNNAGYPRCINQVTNWVTIFELCYCRKMAKMKFSKKGKGGKTLQTPDEKRKAMSHKGRKNQTWKEQQMDRTEELWLQKEDKSPKDKLSMRAIAVMFGLPKTTVIERLSGHCKGHGHITGGKRQPRVLSKGEQAGQNNWTITN